MPLWALKLQMLGYPDNDYIKARISSYLVFWLSVVVRVMRSVADNFGNFNK